jgi:hypothetical protein
MSKTLTNPSPTRRLTTLYIVALCAIALLAISGQTLVQLSLKQQVNDAHIVNIAARQRMLSQKLSKAALALYFASTRDEQNKRIEEVRSGAALWKVSSEGLQNGSAQLDLPGNNSPEVQRLFTVIKPQYERMLVAFADLTSTAQKDQPLPIAVFRTDISPLISVILANEADFLIGQNNIVTQYQNESEARVNRLRIIEGTLLGLTLLVLLLEGTLVFRPTVKKLDQTIIDIVLLERAAAQRKQELEMGIEQLLQTHVQVANGNFAARVPLSQEHVLWQIASALNTLLARIQSLGQELSHFRQERMNAAYTVESLQNREHQIIHELQRVQMETAQLIEVLRDAKAKTRPISTLSSHTLLAPLYKELAGNYLQPSLPSGMK